MKHPFLRLALLLGLFVAGITPRTAAQGENPITWSLAAPRDLKVKPGAQFEVVLTATIDEGWHLYSTTQPTGGPTPTRITLPPGQPFTLAAAPAGPEPKREHDPNFGMETEFYESAAAFSLPIQVASTAPAGRQRVEVHVRFQTCNDRLCLPPKTDKLAFEVAVLGTTASTTSPAVGKPSPEPRAPSPEPRVPSPESRVPSPESRVPSPSPSPEPRAPSPEPRAPSPESRAPSLERRVRRANRAASRADCGRGGTGRADCFRRGRADGRPLGIHLARDDDGRAVAAHAVRVSDGADHGVVLHEPRGGEARRRGGRARRSSTASASS